MFGKIRECWNSAARASFESHLGSFPIWKAGRQEKEKDDGIPKAEVPHSA